MKLERKGKMIYIIRGSVVRNEAVKTRKGLTFFVDRFGL